MAKKKPTPAQLAAYLVRRTPPAVNEALLTDRTFAETLSIPLATTLHFGDAFRADAEDFVAALKSILTGKTTAKVKSPSGDLVTFKGKLDGKGALILSSKGISIRDEAAAILSPDKNLRVKTIKRQVAQTLLPAARALHWRTLAAKRAPSAREYLDFINETRAIPEALHERLQSPQKLSITVLVPTDFDYFTNLLPLPNNDQSYETYVGEQLTRERSHMLGLNPSLAYARIGISAVSKFLIPFELLGKPDAAILETLLGRDDPLSLIFVFEIAAHHAASDPRFIDIGSRALEKLFADSTKSKHMAELFSAFTVITLVGLQRSSKARRAPLYWRRVVACTHAGVLTNALSAKLTKSKAFRKWAFDHFGPQFFWASLADRRIAPRWWPEWVEPRCMQVEFIARAFLALHAMQEHQRPPSWTEVINRLEKEVIDRKEYPRMFFPAAADDFQFSEGQLNPAGFRDTLEALDKTLPFDKIPGLTPFICAAKLSQEHIEQIQKSLANTQQPSKTADLPAYVHSVLLAAQGAAGSRCLPLANLAAEKAIGSFGAVDRIGQDKLLTAIVDAANAISDEAQHHAWLAQRFEQLAFSCATTEQAALISGVIEHLHEAHPRYRLSLSRAHAAAELFLHRQP